MASTGNMMIPSIPFFIGSNPIAVKQLMCGTKFFGSGNLKDKHN